jgi:hypothetical protein
MIKNQKLIPKLIELFQKHGGYWEMDQSEDNNMTIHWHPFISGGKGRMADPIFRKRVYCVKDYYNYAIEELSILGVVEEKIHG